MVAAWLLCGAILRSRFEFFDRIYIPTSVIAGSVGLVTMQMAGLAKNAATIELATAGEVLKGWPTTLIAIVFAGMLLPRTTVPWKESMNAAAREGVMVWIIALGQTAVGLLVTWLVIQRFYDVPHSFGMLLETGFAGGHGTAAAMGQVFASPQVNLPHGLDLGLLMATIGLVYGTLSGIVWINLAARWGWVQKKAASPSAMLEATQAIDERRQLNFTRGLDPLLIQAVWLAMAFGIG